MNYETMIGLWKQQEERFNKWKADLIGQTEALRQTVEKALSPPAETWTDPENQTPHRYVDIVDITQEDLPRGEGLSSKALSPGGALVFGISITLERAPDDHPKNFYQVNLMVKYDDNRPEFAFFDPKNVAEAEWFFVAQAYLYWAALLAWPGIENRIWRCQVAHGARGAPP